MSKFMIASEENQMHLAHYGVKGMRWRQRKAIKNTQGFTNAMRGGTQTGENASFEAKEIERKERLREAMRNLAKNGEKFKNKIKENNKNVAKEAIDKVKNKVETSAAPRKTVRMIGGMFSGGVTAAKGAVDSKNYKREWGKNSSRAVGGPKKKSTSSRKK